MKGQVVLGGGREEEEENGSEVQGLGVADSNKTIRILLQLLLGFEKLL